MGVSKRHIAHQASECRRTSVKSWISELLPFERLSKDKSIGSLEPAAYGSSTDYFEPTFSGSVRGSNEQVQQVHLHLSCRAPSYGVAPLVVNLISTHIQAYPQHETLKAFIQLHGSFAAGMPSGLVP